MPTRTAPTRACWRCGTSRLSRATDAWAARHPLPFPLLVRRTPTRTAPPSVVEIGVEIAAARGEAMVLVGEGGAHPPGGVDPGIHRRGVDRSRFGEIAVRGELPVDNAGGV